MNACSIEKMIADDQARKEAGKKALAIRLKPLRASRTTEEHVYGSSRHDMGCKCPACRYHSQNAKLLDGNGKTWELHVSPKGSQGRRVSGRML